MTEVRFTVPGEPVPKGRARGTIRQKKSGKQFIAFHTPKTTVSYEERVRLVAQAAKPAGWPMRALYEVHVDVFRTVERGDDDNYLKAVKDALNPIRKKGKRPAVPGVMWTDDGRCRRSVVTVFDNATMPRTEVKIFAWPARCKLKGCGGNETLFPDADGRCEACAKQSMIRAKRRA